MLWQKMSAFFCKKNNSEYTYRDSDNLVFVIRDDREWFHVCLYYLMSMKFVQSLVIIFSFFVSIAFAGSMTFSPSTWNLGMYCRYSGSILVDTHGAMIDSLDAKIFVKHLSLSNLLWTLPLWTYERLWSGWMSLSPVTYPRISYALWSPYLYVNWHANTLEQRLLSWNAELSSFLFASNGAFTWWSLDFYSVAWENTDDSNMQSGIVNGMVDVFSDFTSGSYVFSPMPCILDQDAPLFTGYVSWAVYDMYVHTGFTFTIYDYTWNHTVQLNSTQHYRFQSGVADETNLVNYVPVPSGSGIDNQNGVSSGSVSVVLSWIASAVSGTLLPPTMISGLDCSLTYSGPWYPLTWNRQVRGYTCFVPFASIAIANSQTILVMITGADMPNSLWKTHTWFLTFTLDLVKNDTILTIKTYPGSRPWADFSNIGYLKLYDENKYLVASGIVTTDALWSGQIILPNVPTAMYSIVYKWQSQLASYLSGILVTWGSALFLDFTTWSHLFNTQNLSLTQDDGNQYQIAGDLKNINGVYDYKVNGNDLSILTMSGFIDVWVSVLDPKNLNGDTAINVSDISVIGTNVEKTDDFFSGFFPW